MGVPIALLALALVLATASRTPRTALPMLLMVWITGAGLRLRAILLGKARIAALPLYSHITSHQLVITLIRIGCKLLYKISKAHVDPFRKVTIVNVWTQ